MVIQQVDLETAHMRQSLRFDECGLSLSQFINRPFSFINIADNGNGGGDFAKFDVAQRYLNPEQDSAFGFGVPLEGLGTLQTRFLKLLDRPVLRVGVDTA